MSTENKKLKTVKIGSYLLAKNGKTKYLKLEAKPKAGPKTKKIVEDLIKALGADTIFVNVYDEDFKQKYGIKDFVKGEIQIADPDADGEQVQASDDNNKDEMDF